MGTSTQNGTDATVRALLRDGNTRAALQGARHALEAKAAALRRSDPARAALLDAMLAGSLVAQAEALATMQPRRPPGYQGGLPSAEHLLYAYTTARNETGRR